MNFKEILDRIDEMRSDLKHLKEDLIKFQEEDVPDEEVIDESDDEFESDMEEEPEEVETEEAKSVGGEKS